MPTHDPTGEPIEPLTREEAKARIREAIACTNPECERCAPYRHHDDDRPTDTIDTQGRL
jgi:hypothetical protein